MTAPMLFMRASDAVAEQELSQGRATRLHGGWQTVRGHGSRLAGPGTRAGSSPHFGALRRGRGVDIAVVVLAGKVFGEDWSWHPPAHAVEKRRWFGGP